MAPIRITTDDIEKYTGVSGISTAEFLRNAIGVSIAVQRSFAMWGVGTASVAGGEMAIAGIGTLLPGGSQVAVVGSAKTTALGARLMFATGLLATVGALVNIGISMGLPVAQAKQIVRERQFKSGFAYGCVIGLFEYGKPMLSQYRVRSPSAGFGPSYMVGISQKAFNRGLIIGFAAAINFSAQQRAAYRDAMTQVLIEQSKAGGYELYMPNWTDRMWVENYTVPFTKML